MVFEYPVSPMQSSDVGLDWETAPAAPAGNTAKTGQLLSELRHLLENGCSLTTALDVLDEAQTVLSGATAPAAKAEAEILNLSRLLEEALARANDAINQAGITVLRRKTPPRYVRAHEAELRALLHDVIQTAARCSASASGVRMLRFCIRNDYHGTPRLFVEYSGAPPAPCLLVSRGAQGVEVAQDQGRCTISLTFLSRA